VFSIFVNPNCTERKRGKKKKKKKIKKQLTWGKERGKDL